MTRCADQGTKILDGCDQACGTCKEIWGHQDDLWRGIHKLQEEMGELQCVLGKLGPFPDGNHPDGKGDLRQRVIEELADVTAAISYFVDLSLTVEETVTMLDRAWDKDRKFREWGLTGIPVGREPGKVYGP